MRSHDSVNYRQAEPGTFIEIFGCKERVENIFDDNFVHAAPVVFYYQLHVAVVGRGHDIQAAAVRHGLHRVHNQVGQHLEHL